MLSVLLWFLAALALVVLALALTPVRFRLRAGSAPRPRLRLSAAPLGGLVPAIAVYDSARRKPKKPKPERPAPQKPKRRGRAGGMGARAAGAFPRLVAGLLRQIRFDHLRVDADYGLADPADTGMLCGLLAPFAWGLPGLPGVSVALRPDFEAARFEGEVDAGARITPAALLPPMVRFAWEAWGPAR